MSKTWYIYCHTAPNGKRYVGQTRIEPEKRWGKGRGYKIQPYFKRAIDKYGWSNIKHAVLCTVSSQESANFLEQWFIEKWDTTNPKYGYNCAKGGAGPTGVKWDDERKQAFSEYMSGENNPMYGGDHSPESLARMSESCKGRKLSQETRERVTRIVLDANKKRQTPIRQLDMDGNIVAVYPSFSAAVEKTGYSQSSICSCCLGNRKSAYGYMWEYEDEDRRKIADKRRNREDKRRYNEPVNNLRVIQFDANGNEIARFKSITDASRKTGVKRHIISDCCHGNLGVSGNHVWRFESNDTGCDKGLPVIQIDLEGNEIARYDSIDDACNTTGFHRSALLNCCKGRAKTSYGFVWKFIGEQHLSRKSVGRVAVVQFDMSGKEVAAFTSATEAMNATGHDRHRIVECCRGDRTSYRGFQWRYANESSSVTTKPVSGLFS